MSTQTIAASALDHTFQTLAAEWREATRFAADPSAAAEHPAYRSIIDLGRDVVPLILAALTAAPEPSHPPQSYIFPGLILTLWAATSRTTIAGGSRGRCSGRSGSVLRTTWR